MVGRPRSIRSIAADDLDPSEPHQAGSVQALDRGLTLLSIIAEADGLSLTTIAQRADIAASTAHRILMTLKAAEFIQCDETGSYLIGVKAFKVGTAFVRNRKLAEVGRRVIRKLMEESGETASIGIEREDSVVFISQMESHHSIRAFHRPGTRGALHASSLGKAILSTLTDERAAKRLQQIGMERFTGHTIVDADALLADLALTRERGWAVDDQERAEGMRCVGAPVCNEFGEAMGAISISGPLVRITDERLGELGPMVKKAAAEITESIGGNIPRAG